MSLEDLKTMSLDGQFIEILRAAGIGEDQRTPGGENMKLKL